MVNHNVKAIAIEVLVLSADEVWYGFRCLKRNFASVLENTYAFKIASVGLTEASAPVWRHCICKTWRPLLVAILMMTSMNSKMVSKLHPKNKPMLPPISPKSIQEAELYETTKFRLYFFWRIIMEEKASLYSVK